MPDPDGLIAEDLLKEVLHGRLMLARLVGGVSHEVVDRPPILDIGSPQALEAEHSRVWICHELLLHLSHLDQDGEPQWQQPPLVDARAYQEDNERSFVRRGSSTGLYLGHRILSVIFVGGRES